VGGAFGKAVGYFVQVGSHTGEAKFGKQLQMSSIFRRKQANETERVPAVITH